MRTESEVRYEHFFSAFIQSDSDQFSDVEKPCAGSADGRAESTFGLVHLLWRHLFAG